MFFKSLAVLGMFFLPLTAQAGQTEGKVDSVKFFTNNWTSYNNSDSGLMIFNLKEADNPITPACGTGGSRIAISNDHKLYQSVVASVLLAKSTGQQIGVNYLSTCSVSSASWDFGWIELK